ncbi:MAG TPA: aspartate aminotransferase family protein, partial [Candidatus Marinimicrobia bacterium]|nr:aspartate aminotransferase family protein [Candidatus Neomarinimicrobiota bacterium]
KAENPYPELGQKTAWLSGEFESAAESAGVALQTQAMGSMFGLFFSADPVKNYEQALKTDTEQFTRFFRSMLKQGIYLAPSAFESLFVSTAHSEEDLERTATAFPKALRGE